MSTPQRGLNWTPALDNDGRPKAGKRIVAQRGNRRFQIKRNALNGWELRTKICGQNWGTVAFGKLADMKAKAETIGVPEEDA